MAQGDLKETTYNYIVGEKTGIFYSGEQKWINKIKRLAENNSNEVKITYENEDGSILATIPVKWFKISPPRKVSEEQKEAAANRFKKMWAEKQKEK